MFNIVDMYPDYHPSSNKWIASYLIFIFLIPKNVVFSLEVLITNWQRGIKQCPPSSYCWILIKHLVLLEQSVVSQILFRSQFSSEIHACILMLSRNDRHSTLCVEEQLDLVICFLFYRRSIPQANIRSRALPADCAWEYLTA